MNQRKIAVIGGGSWATALVKIMLENLPEVGWFMRNSDRIKYIQKYRHNPQYLSSVELDTDRLRLSDNIVEIVDEYDILILAIPAVFLEDALNPAKPKLEKKTILSAVKGIIPEKNLIIGEFFNQFYNVPLSSIAVLSGPSHAEEVALER